MLYHDILEDKRYPTKEEWPIIKLPKDQYSEAEMEFTTISLQEHHRCKEPDYSSTLAVLVVIGSLTMQ